MILPIDFCDNLLLPLNLIQNSSHSLIISLVLVAFSNSQQILLISNNLLIWSSLWSLHLEKLWVLWKVAIILCRRCHSLCNSTSTGNSIKSSQHFHRSHILCKTINTEITSNIIHLIQDSLCREVSTLVFDSVK